MAVSTRRCSPLDRRRSGSPSSGVEREERGRRRESRRRDAPWRPAREMEHPVDRLVGPRADAVGHEVHVRLARPGLDERAVDRDRARIGRATGPPGSERASSFPSHLARSGRGSRSVGRKTWRRAGPRTGRSASRDRRRERGPEGSATSNKLAEECVLVVVSMDHGSVRARPASCPTPPDAYMMSPLMRGARRTVSTAALAALATLLGASSAIAQASRRRRARNGHGFADAHADHGRARRHRHPRARRDHRPARRVHPARPPGRPIRRHDERDRPHSPTAAASRSAAGGSRRSTLRSRTDR